MNGFENFWDIYGNLALSIGTNALLALSIWLTLVCGMFTLANAAFMGIGAYTAALLTLNYAAPFPLTLMAGMLVPAAVALIIGLPTIRLSGVYLAMATLGFGEVVRVAIINTESLTGGALGLNGIPPLTQWWHVLLSVMGVTALLWRLGKSKTGRAFNAIRSDETAASLMGINVRANKMAAFMLAAAIAGLAGALNAHLTFFISPDEYGFNRSVEILTMTILGGIGGLPGPLLGSTIMTLLPELLRGFSDFRLIVNGLLLLLIILFLPQGIWHLARWSTWSRKRGKVHA
jgi:branched-chain amino acid transport system permease protein